MNKVEAIEANLSHWRTSSSAGGNTEEASHRIKTAWQKHSKYLDVSGLSLKSLPSCIGELKDLEQLHCEDNDLDSLPEEVGELSHLQVLDVHQNRRLKDLPKSLAKVPALQALFTGKTGIGQKSVCEILQVGSTESETPVSPRLPCGSKHDRLAEVEALLGRGYVPAYCGFTHEQIESVLQPSTRQLWKKVQAAPKEEEYQIRRLLNELRCAVKSDILSSLVFTAEQKKALDLLKGKMVMVRSSSNEDGSCLNAGGNESLGGARAEEGAIKALVAEVVSLYFNLHSFKNRSAFEDPYAKLPELSCFFMEQIVEDPNDPLPITSGVMMTSKSGWSSAGEEGITHITASWGFGSGTSNRTLCDEWALTEDRVYGSISYKPSRESVTATGTQKTANTTYLKQSPCLSEKQLKQLKIIAAELERHFKKARNVEFVVKKGRIYIVQDRSTRASSVAKKPTYLDPEATKHALRFEGSMILDGKGEVLTLKRSEIAFASDLKKAEEDLFNPKVHKAVVVYTIEKSNTHPALNFEDQYIPCLVLSYEQVQRCQEMEENSIFQLCPQTATLTQVAAPFPVSQGLFLHPARLLLTTGEGNSVQEESCHPMILQVKELLKGVPEVLATCLSEIEERLTIFFAEIEGREGSTDRLKNLGQKLKTAALAEVESMKRAAQQRQMTFLAFHAAMLRQLIFQSGSEAVGAHSLSGLEVLTKSSEPIRHFIQKHKSLPLLCELALFGLQSFDEEIESRWLHFLAQDHDPSQLEKLALDLKEVESVGMATQWLSTHFASAEAPKIEELLLENKKSKGSELHLFKLKELRWSLQKVSSVEELEAFWKELQGVSDDFLGFCQKNQIRHPLLIDLIDLWDSSTKLAITSHLFSEEEKNWKFAQRVSAFEKFAVQLDPSLKHDLIGQMHQGRRGLAFSVHNWLLPINYNGLSGISTTDQRLTVLHQNLLQSAACRSTQQLPKTLRELCKIFQIGRSNIFIWAEKDELSVRIHIPLNSHSGLVQLSQKKRSDKIKIVAHFRGSDNRRGANLPFFKVFSKITGIALQDYEVMGTSLRVVFAVDETSKALLACEAIDRMNRVDIHMMNDKTSLKQVLSEIDPEKLDREVAEYLWQELKASGQCPELRMFGEGIAKFIWKFAMANHLLEELKNRTLLELQGKAPESDFRYYFSQLVFKALPIEICREVGWHKLLNDKGRDFIWVPKELQQELLTKLFNEEPKKAVEFCRRERSIPQIFKTLMESKLQTAGLKTDEEKDLFLWIVMNGDTKTPESWIATLQNLKEFIFAKRYQFNFQDCREEFYALLDELEWKKEWLNS